MVKASRKFVGLAMLAFLLVGSAPPVVPKEATLCLPDGVGQDIRSWPVVQSQPKQGPGILDGTKENVTLVLYRHEDRRVMMVWRGDVAAFYDPNVDDPQVPPQINLQIVVGNKLRHAPEGPCRWIPLVDRD